MKGDVTWVVMLPEPVPVTPRWVHPDIGLTLPVHPALVTKLMIHHPVPQHLHERPRHMALVQFQPWLVMSDGGALQSWLTAMLGDTANRQMM